MLSDKERLGLLEEAFNTILDNVEIRDKKLKKKLWIIKRKLDGTNEKLNSLDSSSSETISKDPYHEKYFYLKNRLYQTR